MINILLSGCSGQMGRVITELIDSADDVCIAAGFDIAPNEFSYPVYSNLSELKEDIDVIIDFSNPKVFDPVMDFAAENKIPVVIATTGLTDEQKNRIEIESKSSPVFFASNMSLGINLLLELAKKATEVLENSFDVEIIEKHHNKKIDSPSGTAITIAETIKDTMKKDAEFVYDRHSVRKKRDTNEIGIHAVRGGTIVGEHSIIFAGTDEVIEIKHNAHSKKVFATGAINAARYMYKKGPGFYGMNDMLKGQ
jgi:4-hydroxy-tetrahydrodipicolinate reductase